MNGEDNVDRAARVVAPWNIHEGTKVCFIELSCLGGMAFSPLLEDRRRLRGESTDGFAVCEPLYELAS